MEQKNIVRREPMRLALAAPNLADAEMGEREGSHAHLFVKADPAAYWEAEQDGRYGITQPGALPEDEDEMPLVPRPTQRRLGKHDSPPLEDDSMSTQERRGNPTQSTLSTQRPVRATRASSVVSDASSAPSTRSRARAVTTKAKPAAKGKKAAKEPVVIEDSEDEVAEDLDRTPSAFTTSASARTRTRATGTRASTSTLGADKTSATRTGRPTQPSVVPGTSAVSQSMTGRTRRKLLVDDDDDDVTVGSKIYALLTLACDGDTKEATTRIIMSG